MKTSNLIVLIASVIALNSCGSKSVDMLTVINPDGSCYRAFTDSAGLNFLKGESKETANRLPIEIDSTYEVIWQIPGGKPRTDYPISKATYDSLCKLPVKLRHNITLGKKSESMDSVEPIEVDSGIGIAVTIIKRYNSTAEMTANFRFKAGHDLEETKLRNDLKKEFRWFYTYYNYKEIFPALNFRFEIPVSNFLSKDEIDYWLTGEPNLTKGMNGIEIREYAGLLEGKYYEWINKNLWEEGYKALLINYKSLSSQPIAQEKLALLKDSIFQSAVTEHEFIDMEKTLNKFFKTKVFSELWQEKNAPMKKFDEAQEQKYSALFSMPFNYKLILPGKIIESNNAVVSGDTLSWKITKSRFLLKDYTIQAQSRKANIWAFILSAIIGLIAIGSFIWKPRK